MKPSAACLLRQNVLAKAHVGNSGQTKGTDSQGSPTCESLARDDVSSQQSRAPQEAQRLAQFRKAWVFTEESKSILSRFMKASSSANRQFESCSEYSLHKCARKGYKESSPPTLTVPCPRTDRATNESATSVAVSLDIIEN
eukprot:3940023-Rhodomonas_salina.1